MAHELAGALQQAGRIRQRCAVKEPHVYVRSEYIDAGEGRIAQTCNRTAVMQDLSDFVPAFSHQLKPLMRDGAQFTSMLFHPRIDAGSLSTAPLNRSNSVLIVARLSAFDNLWLRSTLISTPAKSSFGQCFYRRSVAPANAAGLDNRAVRDGLVGKEELERAGAST
jgi:hypothetical protein